MFLLTVGSVTGADGVADVVEAGLNHSRRRRFIRFN